MGDMTMRRAGYAPLESAGEYVCECLRDGDRVFPKWGNEVCERVVRCRDCAHYHEDVNGCDEFGDESRGEYAAVGPNGFCAWGELREG